MEVFLQILQRCMDGTRLQSQCCFVDCVLVSRDIYAQRRHSFRVIGVISWQGDENHVPTLCNYGAFLHDVYRNA